MKLSRLLSEIERHIRFAPFSPFTVDFDGTAVNGDGETALGDDLLFAARARSTERWFDREASARCVFLSSTSFRSSSWAPVRFSRGSGTLRSSRRRMAP